MREYVLNEEWRIGKGIVVYVSYVDIESEFVVGYWLGGKYLSHVPDIPSCWI